MITIQVYDYSKDPTEVTIYNERDLEKVSEESGYSIVEIKRHLATTKAYGRNKIAYLKQGSMRSVFERVKEEKDG